MKRFRCLVLFVITACVLGLVPAAATPLPSSKGIVTGFVYNCDSGEPIPFATVRVVGTGKSTLANAEGQYRILLPPGPCELKLSHIGYYSERTTIEPTDSTIVLDFRLHPSLIEIKGIRVYAEAYDPGQRIIVEAIKRKKDILARLQDYSYDAYSKFVVWDRSPEDSSEVMLIAESQTTAYWEQPDKYKEIITARRQTANIPAEGNLMAVGEILNFNKNRVDIGDYAVVSPTAQDALDAYNYYLLDTVQIDSRPVYVLEIEPKNMADPLFVGEIYIADSTYDVVKVDVGFSEGFDLPLLDSVRYSQQFAQFNDEYWMPIEIRFSTILEFKVPIPGIPSKMFLDYAASLYSYSFEQGHAEGTFSEYTLVVEETADDYDTLTWNEKQTIPLTVAEEGGYDHIDSVEAAPKPIGQKIAMGAAAAMLLMTFGDDDLFHYNRVEGAYLGAGVNTDKLLPATDLWFYGGYAFETEKWSYRTGVQKELLKSRKLFVRGEVRNRVTHRPTVYAESGHNSTMGALWYNSDPYDYYREKGFELSLGFRPARKTRMTLTYNDFKQSSLNVETSYSFFGDEEDLRDNPDINDGHLRSLGAVLRYDSRSLTLNKGEEFVNYAAQYFTFETGIEHASPDLISNDYDFTRYWARLHRRQRTLGMGITSLEVYGGLSKRNLPPQGLFTVDHSDPVFARALSFKTLDNDNFHGDEILALYVRHSFENRIFRRSGIPLIKSLPFEFGIHGGAFWTDLDIGGSSMDDLGYPLARTAYSEAGFTLSNLTPFLMPFNLATTFTWRLSQHDTPHFAWHIGMEL